METSKTFKRIGTIVGLEVTKKTQRGIVGKMFSSWYYRHIDSLLVNMKQIKPRTIRVNNTITGEVSYL